jgi:signal transduction histidine kinase
MTYRRHIRLVAGIVFFLLGCVAYRPASATEPKRVLLIHNSVGYTKLVAENIRTEIEQRLPGPVEIYLAPFVAARAEDKSVTARYADYLGALLPDQELDLAVAVGSPAMDFFRQYGRPFFPSTPMLAIANESRLPSTLEANETAVLVTIDLVGAVENILQLLPETTNISVVIGNSPLERYWLMRMQIAFQAYADRVTFRWLNDLSFEDIKKHVASLAPHSAILFYTLQGDVRGVAYADDEAVTSLHAVAKAPIFTFDDTEFGRSIVGGPAPSTQDLSRDYASVALRILGGEALGGQMLPGLISGPPKFDWREMQRWGISESRLPPGSTIYFRDPTAWERYKGQILGISTAIVIQTALIVWLLSERQYRRRAERVARGRLLEVIHLNRTATAGVLSASVAHELGQPLQSILLNTEAAEALLAAKPPDLDQIKEVLSDIRQSDQHASEIIHHLRKLLKRKNEIESQEFDLNDAVVEVLRILSPEARKRRIVLSAIGVSTALLVRADRIHLQQVVLNLLTNAMDAMDNCVAETRTVTVQTAPAEGTKLEVSVVDSGPGIPEGKLKDVFATFYTTKKQGTGLGLSIARTIVETYGGKIWAENRAAGGAIFRLTVPLAKPSPTTAVPDGDHSDATGHTRESLSYEAS